MYKCHGSVLLWWQLLKRLHGFEGESLRFKIMTKNDGSQCIEWQFEMTVWPLLAQFESADILSDPISVMFRELLDEYLAACYVQALQPTPYRLPALPSRISSAISSARTVLPLLLDRQTLRSCRQEGALVAALRIPEVVFQEFINLI